MEEVRIVLSWGALVKVALDTTLLEFIFPFHIEAVSETKEQVAIRARFRKDARRRQQFYDRLGFTLGVSGHWSKVEALRDSHRRATPNSDMMVDQVMIDPTVGGEPGLLPFARLGGFRTVISSLIPPVEAGDPVWYPPGFVRVTPSLDSDASSDEESFEAEEEELANQALELAATEGGFQVALDAPAANGPNPFAVDVSTLPPLLPDLEECVLPPPPPPMHATPQSGAVSLPSPSAAAAAKKEEDERLAKLQNEIAMLKDQLALIVQAGLAPPPTPVPSQGAPEPVTPPNNGTTAAASHVPTPPAMPPTMLAAPAPVYRGAMRRGTGGGAPSTAPARGNDFMSVLKNELGEAGASLRKTDTERSPGGTPLRRNPVRSGPATSQDMIASALRRKFAAVIDASLSPIGTMGSFDSDSDDCDSPFDVDATPSPVSHAVGVPARRTNSSAGQRGIQLGGGGAIRRNPAANHQRRPVSASVTRRGPPPPLPPRRNRHVPSQVQASLGKENAGAPSPSPQGPSSSPRSPMVAMDVAGSGVGSPGDNAGVQAAAAMSPVGSKSPPANAMQQSSPRSSHLMSPLEALAAAAAAAASHEASEED